MTSRITFSFYFCIISSLAFSFSAIANNQHDRIRQIMINDSIARYQGNCPCPYNLTINGSRCGKRSAWSRYGGYSPLCYKSDISDEMVRDFIKQQKDIQQ